MMNSAWRPRLRNTAAVALMAAAPHAFAQDELETDATATKTDDDPTYQVLRLSSVSTDFDNLKDAVSLGGTLGIRIPKLEFLAVEIDLSYTIIPGENEGQPSVLGGGGGGGDCTPVEEQLGLCTPDDGGSGSNDSGNFTRSNNDLLLTTAGVFATLRSPGNLFAVGRLGYRYTESSIPELNEDRTGTAYGVGVGYRYSERGLVELSFNQYGNDIQILTLGVSY